MKKKINHFVPKCLLKRWAVKGELYNGVHVADLKIKNVSFSSSSGKGAFSFAALNDLYILTDEQGERLTNLEDWFSGLENSLSTFIDKIERNRKPEFKELKHANHLFMCVFSFKYRSKYILNQFTDFLRKDEKLVKSYGQKSLHCIVLENVVNGVSHLINQFWPLEIIIWESKAPLLLSDNPLYTLNDSGIEYHFFPLTPKYFMSFNRKLSLQSNFISHKTAPLETTNMFNEMMITNAREWIVSIDKIELERILRKYDNNHQNDQVAYEKTKVIFPGYEY